MSTQFDPAQALASVVEHVRPARGTDQVAVGIARAAAAHVPGADGVSITRISGRKATTLACVGDLAASLDRLQTEVGEGPGFEAAIESCVRIDETRHEQRWPRFVHEALPLGLTSALIVRIPTEEGGTTTLAVYSSARESLGEAAEACIRAITPYAALALDTALREDHFHRALESRHVIGVAKGIVMERFGVDEPRAFDYLRRLSNDDNTKLRDVAQRIVDLHVSDNSAAMRVSDPEETSAQR